MILAVDRAVKLQQTKNVSKHASAINAIKDGKTRNTKLKKTYNLMNK